MSEICRAASDSERRNAGWRTEGETAGEKGCTPVNDCDALAVIASGGGPPVDDDEEEEEDETDAALLVSLDRAAEAALVTAEAAFVTTSLTGPMTVSSSEEVT